MQTAEIVLQSSDEKDFSVPRDVACMSVTVANMLNSISDSMDATGAPIPLPNLTGIVLEKVIEYCKYHKETPAAARAEDDFSVDNITEWDLKFIAVEVPMLFDIVLAANYLDVPTLLDLGCKAIAKLIIGKTPEEIEETFRIRDKK